MEPGVTSDVRSLTARSTSGTSVATAAGLGKRRAWGDLSALEWVYLALSIINVLGTVGLTIYRFVVVIQANETDTADFTLSILIFVNAVFCVYYIFSSLLFEMKHVVFVFLVAICVIVTYCTIDYSVNKERRSPIKLVRLIAAWILGALNIALGIPVAIRFRWLEFRIVGPNETLQKMYREALWFICLIIFDFQVSYSIVVLVLRDGAHIKDRIPEIVVLVLGFIICPLYALHGWFTVRQENKKLAWIFGFFGLLTPAYVIYKIVMIVEAFAAPDDNTSTLDSIALAACALSLIVRGITFFGLYRVSRNFGQGLKGKILGDNTDHRASQEQGQPQQQQPPPEFVGDT